MISIHALREEGDPRGDKRQVLLETFQSTPSARRATRKRNQLDKLIDISIHALREEGDRRRGQLRPLDHISIHALHEEGD